MSDYIIGFGGLILVGGIMWGVCSMVNSMPETKPAVSTPQKLSQQEIDEIRQIKANLKPKKEPAPVVEGRWVAMLTIAMMFLGCLSGLNSPRTLTKAGFSITP